MYGWIFLLAGSVVFFFIVEMLILPKCFLESRYTIGQTADRGIRKYKSANDGVYFVYEPGWLVRRHIKQYVIALEDDRKCLTCMLEEGIEYIRFDVVLFNTSNRVFKVLNVTQLIRDRAYTDEIELPPETAYVTLILNQVNQREFPRIARAKISAGKLVAYGILTCITAMATAYCMNLSFAHLFGKVFRESYAASLWENVTVLGVALAASVVGTLILSFAIALKNQKK